MFDPRKLEEVKKQRQKWEKTTVPNWVRRHPERKNDFSTVSGIPTKRLYTPEDIKDLDYSKDLGFPGEPPFTRGLHATMYRGRFWTMRMFAGFGTAEQTNKRFKYLLKEGETGLSVAFDYPTIMGYDSDHAMSLGEVGQCDRWARAPCTCSRHSNTQRGHRWQPSGLILRGGEGR